MLVAGRMLHVANVGDSRAVLAERVPGGGTATAYVARELSHDQTPFRCAREGGWRAQGGTLHGHRLLGQGAGRMNRSVRGQGGRPGMAVAAAPPEGGERWSSCSPHARVRRRRLLPAGLTSACACSRRGPGS